MPHDSWAVERSVVGIDENGQIMRQGNSLDVGSSLYGIVAAGGEREI